MSGVISVFIGILPAINTTEPYSPSARANANEKPVKIAGASSGKITFVNVWKRVAPRQAEASSPQRYYFAKRAELFGLQREAR